MADDNKVPENATANDKVNQDRQNQDEAGKHNDTRLDESNKAPNAGSEQPVGGNTGVAPNTANDNGDPRVPESEQDKTSPKAPVKSQSQQRREAAQNGGRQSTQASSHDNGKSDDTSSTGHADSSAADDKAKSDEQAKPQNSQSEADKLNEADKKAGRKVSKEEAERRKQAATDPNKSVNDPDFNPDSKADNPDNPVVTDPNPDLPLDGTPTADEATDAGAPLGANTVDAELPDSKKDILAAAKQRVAEINPALQDGDPAAYKDAVTREVLNLTNGDPNATAIITKHWDAQAV